MKFAVLPLLTDYEGKNIVDENKKPIPLRTILIRALNHEDREIRLTPEQKVRAYELSTLIMNNDEVDLKAEDIVQVKKGLSIYSPLVYGQVVALLDK